MIRGYQTHVAASATYDYANGCDRALCPPKADPMRNLVNQSRCSAVLKPSSSKPNEWRRPAPQPSREQVREPHAPMRQPTSVCLASTDITSVSVPPLLHATNEVGLLAHVAFLPDLTDNILLERLGAVNATRAAEEAHGHIRWLRPDYQNPTTPAPDALSITLSPLDTDPLDESPTTGDKRRSALGKRAPADRPPWPKSMPQQAAAIQPMQIKRSSVPPAEIAARSRTATVALTKRWCAPTCPQLREANGIGATGILHSVEAEGPKRWAQAATEPYSERLGAKRVRVLRPYSFPQSLPLGGLVTSSTIGTPQTLAPTCLRFHAVDEVDYSEGHRQPVHIRMHTESIRLRTRNRIHLSGLEERLSQTRTKPSDPQKVRGTNNTQEVHSRSRTHGTTNTETRSQQLT
jgi:hypothetical protein